MSVRVAGIDPGTVSLDVCIQHHGAVVCERSFSTPSMAQDAAPLLDTLREHGPLDLILAPSGHGVPLRTSSEVDERDLSLMVLVRADHRRRDQGIIGFRALIRTLLAADLPLVFSPGAIHLPTIPAYRKHNRIDLGTADKVAAVASAMDDQRDRLGIDVGETSFILLELGGAFTAALAVDQGQIVDAFGGSSGVVGAQACGALDAEVAYLIAPRLSKTTVFSGGALGTGDVDAMRADPELAYGWAAYEDGAVKAVLALTASLPDPREILVSGRFAASGSLVEALARRLDHVAPVRPGGRGAAHGAALLADGLAGGHHAGLVDRLGLREASGTALDYLRLPESEAIELG